ncbi:NETI motif-containing protein [Salsuginibacillus kocurii]|uniref:NETI motif-containing protein n=1 Tax=Salsuginibacillus kocurii TaxID=427078 RepID=UPI0009FCBA08|nr:NETI motif-containing protein [Salsuginibacillus kocurii]
MENESIDDCLARMKAEGYMPVRRMEEPVFTEAESEQDGEPVLLRQQIVFEGKQLLSE